MLKGILVLMLATGVFAVGQTTPPETPCRKASPDTFQLDCVVRVIQLALTQAQSELEDKKLLTLTQADLDFKTVVQKSDGINLTFFIFTLGATHEKDVTNDVSFTWKNLPKQPPAGIETLGVKPKPLDLGKQLTDTIVAASQAIKHQSDIGGLKPLGLTVSIAYGVQNTVSGGVTLPTLVAITPSVSGKYQNNTTQTVKLTFENQ
jgi:hypothetical protein